MSDENDLYVKKMFGKIFGAVGLAFVGYMMFGQLVRDIGIDMFLLYIVFPISYIFMWSSLRKIHASHNALWAEFRILRSEVAKIRAGEETIKNA